MKLSNSVFFRLLVLGSTTVLVGGIAIAANAENTPVQSTTTATTSSPTVPPISPSQIIPSPRPTISLPAGSSESDDATDNSDAGGSIAPISPNPTPTISLPAGSESDDATDNSGDAEGADNSTDESNTSGDTGSSVAGDTGLTISGSTDDSNGQSNDASQNSGDD